MYSGPNDRNEGSTEVLESSVKLARHVDGTKNVNGSVLRSWKCNQKPAKYLIIQGGSDIEKKWW